jgi:2-C-methyl-D-erythritol 4-phosphate cytidylyltransferase
LNAVAGGAPAPFPTVTTAAAILVAAGPGSRLGADRPKALVEIAGAPLLVHALRALIRAPSIGLVVVVAPPDQLPTARTTVQHHGPWRAPVTLVAGGAERQDSVRHGLEAIGAAEVIAIHDAARPFVSADVVEAALAAATRHGAAVVATPATDTVKQVHPDGWITATLPRQHMWLAQTPQVFRADLIRRAHAAAPAGGATDDAILVEQLGMRVYVVRGNPENRKITTPDDLRWAEWLLAQPPGSR